RRLVNDQIDPIDDLLAGGATLEEIAAETSLQLGEILLGESNDEPIAGYLEFRAAADAAKVGDFPEVSLLEDGGLFALRLDEIVPPVLQPLDDVRVAAISAWESAETAKALTAQADALKTAVEGGGNLDSGPITPISATN